MSTAVSGRQAVNAPAVPARRRNANIPSDRFQILELEDKYRNLALAMASTLVSLVDLRDSYTGGHSTRVASYSRLIAAEMGLPDADVERITLAGSLHDIGKI